MFAFQTYQDNDASSIFTCKSSFTPYVPEEKLSMDDHVPESVREEKKKDNGVEYLPGERLLIKLGKQREKEKNSGSIKHSKVPTDVDRITKSLSRVLSNF
jgi:hypothetical protein